MKADLMYLPMHLAPRCSARSKRSGNRCRAPAVRGMLVCRFHGARAGGPKGSANGAYRHGLHTKEAVKERRAIAQLLRDTHVLLARLAKECPTARAVLPRR